MRPFLFVFLMGCASAGQSAGPAHVGNERADELVNASRRPSTCVLESLTPDGATILRVERRFDGEGRLARETVVFRETTTVTDFVHEADGSIERSGPESHRFEPFGNDGEGGYRIFELGGAEPYEVGELHFERDAAGRITSIGEALGETSIGTECTYAAGHLARRHAGEEGWDTEQARYGWESGRLVSIENWEPDPDRPHMPGEATFVPAARAQLRRGADETTAAFRAFDAARGDFSGPLVETRIVTPGCEAMLLGDCAHPLVPAR